MQRISDFISQLDRYILQKEEFDTKNIALLGGLSGIIYYCFSSNNPELKDKGYALLDSLIDEISTVTISEYPYANGICGVLYLLNHLQEAGYIEDDIAYFVEPIEDYIVQKIIPRDYQTDNKDFLYGLYGYLHYFACKPVSNRNHGILESLLRPLIATALETGDAIYFSNNHYNRESIPTFSGDEQKVAEHKAINFGLAHGNGAIGLIFLDVIEKYPSLSTYLTGQIEGLANLYVRNYKADNAKEGNTLFPVFMIEEKDYRIFNNIPLAWCYGDLSVAIFLYRTTQLTGNKKYGELAMQTAEQHLHHTDFNENIDAYFCHGYAGFASQYESLHAMTGQNVFSLQKEKWTDRLLSALEEEIDSQENQGQFFEDKLDLLNGALAIGLLYNSKTPKWKKIFLN